MPTKVELRKSILQKRESLPESEVHKRSAVILASLENMPEFRAAEHVCIYISAKNEVHTHQFIKDQLKLRKISVPKGTTISHLAAWDGLKPNAFGILEPVRFIPAGNVDLFIVPGAVFGLNGHRIGYGKGYYDKLLAHNKAFKVGLAYDFQVVGPIPAENHDIPVNKIITEKRVIQP